jgi:hypothetical protein
MPAADHELCVHFLTDVAMNHRNTEANVHELCHPLMASHNTIIHLATLKALSVIWPEVG